MIKWKARRFKTRYFSLTVALPYLELPRRERVPDQDPVSQPIHQRGEFFNIKDRIIDFWDDLNKKQLYIFGAALTIVALMCFLGGVSMGNTKYIQAEVSDTKVKALETKVRELTANLTASQLNYALLYQSYSSLQNNYNNVYTNYMTLYNQSQAGQQGSIADQQTAYYKTLNDALTKQITDLQAQNNSLQRNQETVLTSANMTELRYITLIEAINAVNNQTDLTTTTNLTPEARANFWNMWQLWWATVKIPN